MSSRIRMHIRSNVVGYIALFLVVTGGTAQALGGSNTVFSDDIVNKEVKTSDIDTRAVTSNRLAPNSVKAGNVINDSLTGLDVRNLTGDDVSDDSLNGADVAGLTGDDVTNDSLTGDDVYPNSLGGNDVAGNSITGAEVNEATLQEVPSAALGGIGRSNAKSSDCDPESQAFATCVFTTLNLPIQTRVLLVGSIRASTEVDSDVGFGDCRLASSSGYASIPYRAAVIENNNGSTEWMSLTAVVTQLQGPGPVDFGIECNQVAPGAIHYQYMTISAVGLSPG